MAVREPSLEIEQDDAFLRRSFFVQRAAWIVMALVVAAAAAGLLGSGPLAKAGAAAPGAFAIEYERLTRYQAPQTLGIRLEPGVTNRGEARVWIGRAFLDSSQIESVVPPPLRVEGAADRLHYVFRMAKPGDALFVTFSLRAEQIGLVEGRIGVGDGPEVAFKQLVYP